LVALFCGGWLFALFVRYLVLVVGRSVALPFVFLLLFWWRRVALPLLFLVIIRQMQGRQNLEKRPLQGVQYVVFFMLIAFFVSVFGYNWTDARA
jgi:hypothetical protein